jgi:hypothetical protein
LVVEDEFGRGVYATARRLWQVNCCGFGQKICSIISWEATVSLAPNNQGKGWDGETQEFGVYKLKYVMVDEGEWGTMRGFRVFGNYGEGVDVGGERLIVSENDTLFGRELERADEFQAYSDSSKFSPSGRLNARELEEEIEAVGCG